MIAAKTRMKRLPDTCAKCSMSQVLSEGFGWGDYERVCRITGKSCPMEKSPKNGCLQYTKPENCPLIVLAD